MTQVDHYDFTHAGLDFIINHDIKYRIGRTGKDSKPLSKLSHH